MNIDLTLMARIADISAAQAPDTGIVSVQSLFTGAPYAGMNYFQVQSVFFNFTSNSQAGNRTPAVEGFTTTTQGNTSWHGFLATSATPQPASKNWIYTFAKGYGNGWAGAAGNSLYVPLPDIWLSMAGGQIEISNGNGSAGMSDTITNIGVLIAFSTGRDAGG